MVKIFKIRRAFWTNHKWFSFGFHVDLDKKYVDFHLGKYLLTIGNNKIPDLPPDARREINTYWKEYCKKCNGVIKRCSMGCHNDHTKHNV